MTVDVLMTTLAILHAAPFPSKKLDRDLVAFFMGRQSGSHNSTFKCDLSAASKAGYITYPDARTVQLTEAGLASIQARVGKPPMSNEDVHDHLLRVFDHHRTKQLFAILSDGQIHTREDVARQLGFKSHETSTFKCYCSTESRRGLIYYPSTKTMALKDFAFPFGRPVSPPRRPPMAASAKNKPKTKTKSVEAAVCHGDESNGVAQDKNGAHAG